MTDAVEADITAELAEAMALVDTRRDAFNRTSAAHTEAEAREREAWGDSSRDDPIKPDEWKQASQEQEKLAPVVQKTMDALLTVEQQIERLSSATELPLRLDLAAYVYLEG